MIKDIVSDVKIVEGYQKSVKKKLNHRQSGLKINCPNGAKQNVHIYNDVDNDNDYYKWFDEFELKLYPRMEYCL
jgi:hypothetical protein